MPFETKLAIVLDSHSSSFAQIIQIYAAGKHCAHHGARRTQSELSTRSTQISIVSMESCGGNFSGPVTIRQQLTDHPFFH